MNRQEQQRSREYRDHLAKTLSFAKLRLSPNDFEAFAPAVRSEINKIDEALGRYELQCFMGCNREGNTSGFVSIVRETCMTLMTQRRQPSVQFNSPIPSSPWASTREVEVRHVSTDIKSPFCSA
jgi:hypothetical protein